jgi:Arc/MetJ-type ribon-helix-helix transcriptional regulator
MDKSQINVRLSAEQLDAIDRKRIELQPTLGRILNRSDVLRLALDLYLGLGETQGGQAGTKKARK